MILRERILKSLQRLVFGTLQIQSTVFSDVKFSLKRLFVLSLKQTRSMDYSDNMQLLFYSHLVSSD